MPDPILLDTNVLKDISRGHQQAAQALRRYIDTGRTVYIAQASYNELLERAPSEQFRAHYREIVRDTRPRHPRRAPRPHGVARGPVR